jgi:archaellum component FlaC
MADEPENLTHVMLRRIDQRLQSMDIKLDRLSDDVHDLKVRMASVEEGLVGIHRRIDRLEVRVERIERRLELADAPL